MDKAITVFETVDNFLQMKETWLSRSIVERKKIMSNFHKKVDELSTVAPYDTNRCMVHWYGDNTYGREANVDKGVLMVGSVYKEPQINILLQGKVFVMTENFIDIMTAPFIFTSEAGTNKVGVVLEKMQWITVVSRKNNIVDPDEIMKNHTVGG